MKWLQLGGAEQSVAVGPPDASTGTRGGYGPSVCCCFNGSVTKTHYLTKN